MKVIIEISESDIPKQQDFIEIPLHFINGEICEAGGYGFCVLPKGYGRLIDAKAYEQDIRKHYFDNSTVIRCTEITLDNAPTIIEADKESEE